MKLSRTIPLLFPPTLLLAAVLPSFCQTPSDTYSLESSRKAGQIDRVATRMEVTGHALFHAGAKAEKTTKSALSVNCLREYDEKTLESALGAAGAIRTIRYYHAATAELKQGEEVRKLALSPERRLIAASLEGSKTTLFSPRGPLTEDELELVIAVGNNLPLEQLLPERPVAIGQKWKCPDQVLGALLDLQEVASNSVEVVLKEVTPAVARLEIDGRVQGTRYGAANDIELRAKCRFDRKTRRADWFAMHVKQTREANTIEQALDVEVTVQIRITPQEDSPQLADAALKDLVLAPNDDVCQVLFRSAEGGWSLEHDRGWFLVDHRREMDEFHLLDKGRFIAMCKISPLPKIDPEKLPPVARFQADVQQALKKAYRDTVEAAEFTSEAGYRVYRVIAAGQDPGAAVPAEKSKNQAGDKEADGEVGVFWHYYLLTNKQGRQLTLVFRVEEKEAELFGKAAERLVKGIRFLDAKPAAKP